jgi:signal peptidase I
VREGNPAANAFVDIAKAVAVAVVLSIGINSFLLQVVDVRQSSMETTLEEGDRILLSKVDYRFQTPRRGEIIVFRPPAPACPFESAPCVPFVKRVIGVAGDRIELIDGKVYLNGAVLVERYARQPTTPEGDSVTYPFVVPADSVFVLGDNRPVSGDSRAWGAVSRERILGKAYVDFWPPAHAKWLVP